MSTFNYIIVNCPNCQTEVEFQSKSGSCQMERYHISEVPLADMRSIISSSQFCPECGTKVIIGTGEKKWDFSNLIKEGKKLNRDFIEPIIERSETFRISDQGSNVNVLFFPGLRFSPEDDLLWFRSKTFVNDLRGALRLDKTLDEFINELISERIKAKIGHRLEYLIQKIESDIGIDIKEIAIQYLVEGDRPLKNYKLEVVNNEN